MIDAEKVKQRQKRYREKHKDKLLAANATYRQTHLEKYREYSRRYRERDSGLRVARNQRKYRRKTRTELRRQYIIHMLSCGGRLRIGPFNENLIRLKREQIKAYRLIKEIKRRMRDGVNTEGNRRIEGLIEITQAGEDNARITSLPG